MDTHATANASSGAAKGWRAAGRRWDIGDTIEDGLDLGRNWDVVDESDGGPVGCANKLVLVGVGRATAARPARVLVA